MKTVLSLDEAREQIASLGERVERHKLENAEFAVGDETMLLTSGKEPVELKKSAITDLTELAAIPSSFLMAECEDAELRRRIIQYCLKKNPCNAQFLIRRNSIARIVDVPGEIISAEDIFEEALLTREDWKGFDVQVNGTIRIKALTEFKKGRDKDDVVEAGLFLEISRQVRFASYLERVVCSNGMTRTTFQSSFTENATRDALPLIRFQARKALDNAEQQFVDDFLDTTRLRAENPSRIIHQLGRRFNLSSRLERGLLDRAPSLPRDATYYDLVNLVTESARDFENEGKTEFTDRLQEFADYGIQTAKEKLCSQCNQPL